VPDEKQCIRIAAAGDVHAHPETRDRLEASFERIQNESDLILLAGDLTTLGDPAEAVVLAEACRGSSLPILAVLGNHDLHRDHGEEIAGIMRAAGVTMLDRSFTVVEVEGVEVGIAGTKGFVGGFPGSALADFGEQMLRSLYAETSAEVAALGEGLQAVAHCPLRIVLLHYSPSAETLVGEPEGIWTYLGSERLAAPIAEHRPDLVLHGHAHAGTFEGRIGDTPVYNVAVHVTGKDFYVFELEATPGRSAVEVDPQGT
jgi:Icc-related predicted phosphoesterase